jgi:hypothetical protein
MAFNLAAIKVVKNVTLPLLKMLDNGTPYYVKFISEIYPGKDNKTGKVAEGDAQQKVPDLIQVVNLETGEEQELIVSAVLKAELEEQYPELAYKGKMFRLQKFAKADGKKYATFQIAEIDIDETAAPQQEAAPMVSENEKAVNDGATQTHHAKKTK